MAAGQGDAVAGSVLHAHGAVADRGSAALLAQVCGDRVKHRRNRERRRRPGVRTLGHIRPPMRFRDEVVRESALADWLGGRLVERVKQAARRLVRRRRSATSGLASAAVLVIAPWSLAVVSDEALRAAFAARAARDNAGGHSGAASGAGESGRAQGGPQGLVRKLVLRPCHGLPVAAVARVVVGKQGTKRFLVAIFNLLHPDTFSDFPEPHPAVPLLALLEGVCSKIDISIHAMVYIYRYKWSKTSGHDSEKFPVEKSAVCMHLWMAKKPLPFDAGLNWELFKGGNIPMQISQLGTFRVVT